jgi:hypothetical protein
MIRRNITLDDGTQLWLLISQVEHARMSGELTRAWRELFSQEVVDAITHHDDGWAKWEVSPTFDPVRGRPLSFTEMDVADAITIWNDSIAAARRIGPLAGAIVAGHFVGLASGSDHASRPPANAWLQQTKYDRTRWLGEWQLANPSLTPAVVDEAQQMLLTADLLSLWLCMNGPVSSGSDDAAVSNSEMQTRTSTVLGKFHFVPQTISVGNAEIAWQGSLAPWPFAATEVNLEAPALAVPAAKYTCWAEIAAAGRPVRLDWQLRKTLPPVSEC